MDNTVSPYSKGFYKGLVDGSLASARVIVPMVLELVPARSVCDVGCGMGTWLQAYMENGVDDVLGFDGPWVDENALKIPKDRFRRADLSKPLDAGRKFDLASSLEVAEHLPGESAAQFVKILTGLAPTVLFSAAIPYQGGTGHINEQWPSYWAGHFASHGYVAIDWLRSKIWQDPNVEWWYQQNIMLFANAEALQSHARLADIYEAGPRSPVSLVHPELFIRENTRYFSGTVKTLPGLFSAAIKRRLTSKKQ